MKTALSALFLVGIWLSPPASADPQDQPFLSYLAAHKAVVDKDTAISAVHFACAQMAQGIPTFTIETALLNRFPTTINGTEYWIVAGAHQIYCPHP